MTDETFSGSFQFKLNSMCAELLAACTASVFPHVIPLKSYAWEGGFWYEFRTAVEIDEHALPIIETEMQRWINQKKECQATTMMRENACAYFQNKKLFHLVQRIQNSPYNLVGIYRIDEYYLLSDCEMEDLQEIRAFVLSDVTVVMAQDAHMSKTKVIRISGASFQSKQEAKAYAKDIAKAKKNDPRAMAQSLNLCLFSHVDPLQNILLPQGTVIWTELASLVRKRLIQAGYCEILSPTLGPCPLFERKGLSLFEEEDISDDSEIAFTDTTMNHLYFWEFQKTKVSREEPLKVFEVGQFFHLDSSVFLEPLLESKNGLGVRQHVFCSQQNVGSELESLLQSSIEMAKMFNLGLSLNLTIPKRKHKNAQVLDFITEVFTRIATQENLSHSISYSEIAYSGPKIELHAKDLKHRLWTIAMCGIDFEAGRYMQHEEAKAHSTENTLCIAASFPTSFERLLALALESTHGWLPFIFSPVQVSVFCGPEYRAKTQEFVSMLRAKGFRVEYTPSIASLSVKCIEKQKERCPYLVVIGQDVENDMISVRNLQKGIAPEILHKDLFLKELQERLVSSYPKNNIDE